MPTSIGGKAEYNDELVQAVRAVFEKKKKKNLCRRPKEQSDIKGEEEME
jgi:hypothetical protein